MQRALVVLVALVMAPPGAAAEITEWTVEVHPTEPSAKVKDPPPSLRVRAVGEPAPRPDEKDRFKLELSPDDNPGRLRGVAPSEIIPFHRSQESLAIVVLVEGHQYYFGNEQYTTAQTGASIVKVATGVYDVIRTALDAPGGAPADIPTTISRASLNPQSKGALIVYSVGADVRHPMRPLGELVGERLGPQELQKGKTSRELAEGLRTALPLLQNTAATRKVLFLISDGFDSAGIDEFRALRRQYDNAKIDIFAFHLVAATEFIPVGDGEAEKNRRTMKALGDGGGGGYFNVANNAALASKIANAVETINSRFYLTFPGQLTDPRSKVKSGFDWDGKEHEVRLVVDDAPLERGQVVLFTPVWGQPRPKSRWWLWALIGGGGALLIGVVALIATRKPAPPPQPMVAPAPVAPPPPSTIQPAAAGSNKTMAINLNAGDGVPVVGWIVPINGPQQFQTFKLFAGVTRIGNATGAHIVIHDAFMSGEHAHVVMSPQGFTLIDNGSTNGVLVNERRVQRHELIDNDVIRFGKTDVKFKTINTDA